MREVAPALLHRLAMMNWVVLLFVVAVIAAIFGFGGIAASAAGTAKLVFLAALAAAVILFIADRSRVPQ